MTETTDTSALMDITSRPPVVYVKGHGSWLEDSEGNVTVTLELLHNDPQLSVPLLVADDLDDVAADWRAWADAYRLPMLLIEADGIARTLEESLGAAIKALPPQDRRK